MNNVDLQKAVEELETNVDTSAYLLKSLSEWRVILASECQVYVCGENYLAKRFDQIHFKFCDEAEAARVVRDNLFALLRFKYFTRLSEEVDERIQKIVSSFTVNLKTTLKKVSFDVDSDCHHVKMIPDYCCAFRNGVYDFLNDRWLFKYDIKDIPLLSSKLYMYDMSYIITWYVNINFTAIPSLSISNEVEDIIDLLKDLTKVSRNYCFELLYNMSHSYDNVFSLDLFKHWLEVIGFSILRSFSQNFVIIVGSGQNGKNSLFDGCLVSKVVPTPASNSLESLETDKFITGALENIAQNISLETSTEDKKYTESRMLKLITGSMYQTIEAKNVSKYSGILNCKIITAANDQDKIKFTDNTIGFRRRINVIEVWYTWDKDKRFLKTGDYFDTTFSDSLYEIKDDVSNTIVFIYLAMMGIKLATRNFTKNFSFDYNDWKLKYADVDIEMKDKIEELTSDTILRFMSSSKQNSELCKVLFYDTNKTRLYSSLSMIELGYKTYDDMKKMFADVESLTSYFAEHDAYINIKLLRQIVGSLDSATSFTQSIKKIYSIDRFAMLYNNQPYVKCTFIGKRLKLLK